MADSDCIADDGGGSLAGKAVLGDVHDHVVLDVGLVANDDGIDVTCTHPARIGRERST